MGERHTMLSRPLEVDAPCRLHFGLLSFGCASPRQFGGVGVMVADPRLRLRVVPANAFGVCGPRSDRVEHAARLWSATRGLSDLPACRIETISVPRAHTGLGTGTQLALAVAAGLDAFCQLPDLPVEQLGPALGRGQRSAVGLHGFRAGGLIAELGKLAPEQVSPLYQRVELPTHWQFALFCPRGRIGLHGPNEADLFGSLPPVSPEMTEHLFRELTARLLPAAAAGDWAAFGESVYHFGRQAGLCYAAHQGGPYYSHQAESLVERIRELGIPGVGQSSWGPTIYALCRDETDAGRLTEQLRADGLVADCDVTITPASNRGATVLL